MAKTTRQYEALANNRKARRQAARQSSNPFKRWFANRVEKSVRMNEANIAAKEQTATAREAAKIQRKNTQAKTANQVKITKAKNRGKIAVATAAIKASQDVSKALLVDENQKDQREHEQTMDRLNTILGPDSGLQQGVE